jgi:hypothetical protein
VFGFPFFDMRSVLTILVVIYKKEFWESATLKSIANISKSQIFKSSKLIIWDNSPSKMSEKGIGLLKNYFSEAYLIHTPQNESLSKIYNSVVDDFLKQDEYLVLLDHDTMVTTQYFNEVLEKIGLINPPALLLPPIVVNDRIESPAYQYVLFTKKWSAFKEGFYNSKFVTAINSGMVISEAFFSSGFRYDERLKFYGTDSYMMHRYNKYNNMFYLLNCSLKHDLNLQSNSSIDQKIQVFKAIKTANLIIYSSNLFYQILTRINNLIIASKYSIKFLSLKFFR